MTYKPDKEEIKYRRDVYLQRSDIYVLIDRWETYTNEQKAALITFRQALRDLPSQNGFPDTFDWPTSPVNLGDDLSVGKPPEWV